MVCSCFYLCHYLTTLFVGIESEKLPLLLFCEKRISDEEVNIIKKLGGIVQKFLEEGHGINKSVSF
jgi:hypothetical protein